MSRSFKKHYASYIKFFPEPSENFEHTFYDTINSDYDAKKENEWQPGGFREAGDNL